MEETKSEKGADLPYFVVHGRQIPNIEALLQVPKRLYDDRCGAAIGAMHARDLEAVMLALGGQTETVRIVPGGVMVVTAFGSLLLGASDDTELGLILVRNVLGQTVGEVRLWNYQPKTQGVG